MTQSLYQQLVKERQKAMRRRLTDFQPPVFVQPLIIVSAPREGSTLLFETGPLLRPVDDWLGESRDHQHFDWRINQRDV